MSKFVVRCAYEITLTRDILVEAEDALLAGEAAIRLAEIARNSDDDFDVDAEESPIYIDAICEGHNSKHLTTKPLPLAKIAVGASKPKP